jgi:hypothetical protein
MPKEAKERFLYKNIKIFLLWMFAPAEQKDGYSTYITAGTGYDFHLKNCLGNDRKFLH